MISGKSGKKNQFINQIASLSVKAVTASQAKAVKAFTQCYFINANINDLEIHTPLKWADVVVDHFNTLCQKSEETSIRIFNPSHVYADWESQRTVVMMVSRDMPFLIDSLRMAINRYGYQTYLIIDLNGIQVNRDEAKNTLKIVLEPTLKGEGEETSKKTCIYIELNRKLPEKELSVLEQLLLTALGDVRRSVDDWEAMRDRLKVALHELETLPLSKSIVDYEETLAFIRWLEAHFIFLGYRYFKLGKRNKNYVLRSQLRSGLGVLRKLHVRSITKQYSSSSEVQDFTSSKQIIIFSKTKSRSTVHRPSYTDFIAIKTFNEQEEVIGEHHFIGLYTSDAYCKDPEDIPFLRLKLKYVLDSSHLASGSYAGHKLVHIIKNLPRDELFQANSVELFDLSMSILSLERQERRRVCLFVRQDPYNRFFSCLIFIPRNYFSTRLLLKIRDLLRQKLQGTDISFFPYFSDSAFIRIHYMVRVNPKVVTVCDRVSLEQKLIEIAYPWRDGLLDQLRAYFGEDQGSQLFDRYCQVFPVGYQAVFTAQHAV